MQWTSKSGNIISEANTLNPAINKPGTYILKAISDSGCISFDSTIIIDNIVYPFVDAGNSPGEFNCYDTLYILDAAGNGSYSWLTTKGKIIDNATTGNPVIVQPGTYILTVTGTNGCQSADSVIVNREVPDIICPDNMSRIAEAGSGKYTVIADEFDPLTVDDKCGNLSITNSFNDSTTLAGEQFESDASIIWTVTNESGLSDTCIFHVDIQEFVIPNIFTPNADGHFDTWQFTINDAFPDAVIKIYNRWGELIYISEKGYYKKWDGRINGNRVPVDSYLYTISQGNKVIYKGSVTVFY